MQTHNQTHCSCEHNRSTIRHEKQAQSTDYPWFRLISRVLVPNPMNASKRCRRQATARPNRRPAVLVTSRQHGVYEPPDLAATRQRSQPPRLPCPPSSPVPRLQTAIKEISSQDVAPTLSSAQSCRADMCMNVYMKTGRADEREREREKTRMPRGRELRKRPSEG